MNRVMLDGETKRRTSFNNKRPRNYSTEQSPQKTSKHLSLIILKQIIFNRHLI